MSEVADVAIAGGDQVLVDLARGGDHAAFARLVELRLPDAYRRALAILGDESDARDATQDVFMRAWRSLPSLRDATRFDAWLMQITINTCRSAIRGRRRRLDREIPIDEMALPYASEAVPGPEAGLGAGEAVSQALDRLTPLHRVLLALHYHEGRSLADIGRLLGMAPNTVKSRLFNARRALERAMEVER
jgi:RNA polymerase sigma-70 factor (ECF subfamily)